MKSARDLVGAILCRCCKSRIFVRSKVIPSERRSLIFESLIGEEWRNGTSSERRIGSMDIASTVSKCIKKSIIREQQRHVENKYILNANHSLILGGIS